MAPETGLLVRSGMTCNFDKSWSRCTKLLLASLEKPPSRRDDMDSEARGLIGGADTERELDALAGGAAGCGAAGVGARADAAVAAAAEGPEPETDRAARGFETTREFDGFLAVDGPAPNPSDEGYDGRRRTPASAPASADAAGGAGALTGLDPGRRGPTGKAEMLGGLTAGLTICAAAWPRVVIPLLRVDGPEND